MNDIKEILTLTLESLTSKNLLATPTNFEKEFYRQLEDSDLMLEESIEIKDIVSKLSSDEKARLTDDIYSFRDLATILSERVSNQDIREFLKDFSYFISPSINNSVKEKVYKVCGEIANEPSKLVEDEIVRKLRKVTDERISIDKKLFKEKTLDVKKLIYFLGDYLNKFLLEHGSTKDEVVELKDEIKKLELSQSSKKDLEVLQTKFLNTIEKFESTLDKNKETFEKNKEQYNSLYNQIEQLQQELDKAEEEKSIDFLTKVLTRRAYSLEVNRFENEYKVFDSNYAIVFYDIDHFKKINDRYGHDCGDFVLATFAKILQKLTRTGDIIARYGGEEFICLISYKNKFEVMNYLKRVKNIISNNTFVYNDIKIDVEFCAGVVFRKHFADYDFAIKKADELLYDAKNSGRNKIMIETGEVL